MVRSCVCRSVGRFVARGVWWGGCVLTWTPVAGAASDHVAQAIRSGLPTYDSRVRESAPIAPPVPVNEHTHRDRSATDEAEPPAVVLPRIVVRPTFKQIAPPPALALPRTKPRPAPGREPPVDPFMSPEAKAAALVKKHFTPFDRQVLNRFTLPLFGTSKEKRAQQAEAVEQGARQLGAIADLAELASLAGEGRAEQKKLKELYLDAFVGRAK